MSSCWLLDMWFFLWSRWSWAEERLSWSDYPYVPHGERPLSLVLELEQSLKLWAALEIMTLLISGPSLFVKLVARWHRRWHVQFHHRNPTKHMVALLDQSRRSYPTFLGCHGWDHEYAEMALSQASRRLCGEVAVSQWSPEACVELWSVSLSCKIELHRCSLARSGDELVLTELFSSPVRSSCGEL